jgi:alpha-beta hydrolase superfamily lysophospholipase
LLKLLHKKKSSNTINLPILLLNGKEDPVVGGKIGYKQTITDLNTQGFDNLTHVEFDNMRHEILNEKENILVYQEIDKFLGE